MIDEMNLIWNIPLAAAFGLLLGEMTSASKDKKGE